MKSRLPSGIGGSHQNDESSKSPVARSQQNFALGAFTYLHFSHSLLKGAVHSLQNSCSAGFSAPQAGNSFNSRGLVEQLL